MRLFVLLLVSAAAAVALAQPPTVRLERSLPSRDPVERWNDAALPPSARQDAAAGRGRNLASFTSPSTTPLSRSMVAIPSTSARRLSRLRRHGRRGGRPTAHADRSSIPTGWTTSTPPSTTHSAASGGTAKSHGIAARTIRRGRAQSGAGTGSPRGATTRHAAGTGPLAADSLERANRSCPVGGRFRASRWPTVSNSAARTAGTG